MIKNRSVALSVVLTIVTCGIYGLYWLYCMAEEVKVATNDPEDTSGIMLILLTIVTCGIYGWYWLYKTGSALDNMRTQRGEASGSLGILYMVLAIFGLGIVSYALLQSELNKYANA